MFFLLIIVYFMQVLQTISFVLNSCQMIFTFFNADPSMNAPVDGKNLFQSPTQRKALEQLERKLNQIYSSRDLSQEAFRRLLEVAIRRLAERSPELKELDAQRAANPQWFSGNQLMAYSTYVDKFGGNLDGIRAKINWLRDLGVNYLHLLPFLKMRPGQSDGGFAVENFLEVEPTLGDHKQLESLVKELRANGISLCSDLVLNHVADTHEWAIKARNGDPAAQAFFYWKTEEEASRFETNLAQIFPQTAPGNFVYIPEIGKYVWSTFYQYQWDLNYTNPEVLASMADNMLGLANLGVEVFRLDSAAFLWKREGTNCMNQPECHWLLQCLRAMVDLVAPGVLLKAEAIVPTAELPPYFGQGEDEGRECHLAYQSSLMAGAWFSLANQNTQLLRKQISEMPEMPSGSNWICYMRCHDDIGWNVLKPEINPAQQSQLKYASAFFGGQVTDSYANGLTFQANSPDAVHGTNGMLSELLGWRQQEDESGFARYKLMLSLAFSLGGIPMIYMGDELAQANAPSTAEDQARWVDSRDLHRPAFDENARNQVTEEPSSRSARAFNLVKQLRQIQKSELTAVNTSALKLIDTGFDSLLVFRHEDKICLFNFSTQKMNLNKSKLGASGKTLEDRIESRYFILEDMAIEPYDSMWLIEHDA